MLFVLMISCPFTNDAGLYSAFQKQIHHRIDVTSGTAGVYLGNHIKVDKANLAIGIDQTTYIEDLLDRFDTSNCNPNHLYRGEFIT